MQHFIGTCPAAAANTDPWVTTVLPHAPHVCQRCGHCNAIWPWASTSTPCRPEALQARAAALIDKACTQHFDCGAVPAPRGWHGQWQRPWAALYNRACMAGWVHMGLAVIQGRRSGHHCQKSFSCAVAEALDGSVVPRMSACMLAEDVCTQVGVPHGALRSDLESYEAMPCHAMYCHVSTGCPAQGAAGVFMS